MTRSGPFRVLHDMLSQASGIAIIAAVAVLFVSGAAVGLTMIGRLGGSGWIIYAAVITSYGLVFGPLFVGGVTLHQRGSRRARAATQRRIEEQRLKFGLHVPTAGDKDSRCSG
jgi:hypothetical protein